MRLIHLEWVDPVETRRWIMRGLRSIPEPERRQRQEAAEYRLPVRLPRFVKEKKKTTTGDSMPEKK